MYSTLSYLVLAALVLAYQHGSRDFALSLVYFVSIPFNFVAEEPLPRDTATGYFPNIRGSSWSSLYCYLHVCVAGSLSPSVSSLSVLKTVACPCPATKLLARSASLPVFLLGAELGTCYIWQLPSFFCFCFFCNFVKTMVLVEFLCCCENIIKDI